MTYAVTKPSGGWRRVAVAGALAMAAVVCASGAIAQGQAPGEKWALTPHQKGIPGPAKLTMSQADYSGSVNTDPQFIADRLAILNHMTAYSYLIDEGRWDQWFALFSDDVVFESTVPCFATLTAKGKEAFKAVTDVRYIEGGPTTAMRRHTMGNIHVAEQTPTTAKVRTYMLISAVPNADKLNVLTTGTYNANFEKRNGKWTITRWYIEVDAPVAESPMPKNVPPGTVTFIPDVRPACQKK